MTKKRNISKSKTIGNHIRKKDDYVVLYSCTYYAHRIFVRQTQSYCCNWNKAEGNVMILRSSEVSRELRRLKQNLQVCSTTKGYREHLYYEVTTL